MTGQVINLTITTAQIKKVYGGKGAAARVTGQHAKRKLMALNIIRGPVKKGGQTYRVLGTLPGSVTELNEAYAQKFQTWSVVDAYTDALSEIECLQNEMSDWRDNLDMSEGLSQTAKYDEVSEAADALENAYYELEAFEELNDILGDEERILVVEPYDIRLLTGRSRNLGRARRMANALAGLNAVVEWLTPDKFEDAVEYTSAIDFLSDTIDELECVEFPSMF
jgi:hypothetical protein